VLLLIYKVSYRPDSAIINLLNRKNAGALDPRLEYDPTADRPRIVEQRDQSIPRLPTVGIRFKF